MKQTKTFSIEQEYLDAIANYAEEQDRSVNYIVGAAIKEYLTNKGVLIASNLIIPPYNSTISRCGINPTSAAPVPQNSKNEATPAAAQLDSYKQAKTANKPTEQKQSSNSAASTKNKAAKMIKQPNGSWVLADKAEQTQGPEATPIIDTTELTAINEQTTEDEF